MSDSGKDNILCLFCASPIVYGSGVESVTCAVCENHFPVQSVKNKDSLCYTQCPECKTHLSHTIAAFHIQCPSCSTMFEVSRNINPIIYQVEEGGNGSSKMLDSEKDNDYMYKEEVGGFSHYEQHKQSSLSKENPLFSLEMINEMLKKQWMSLTPLQKRRYHNMDAEARAKTHT